MKRMNYYDWVEENYPNIRKEQQQHWLMMESFDGFFSGADIDVIGYDSGFGYRDPVIEMSFENGTKIYLYGMNSSLISVKAHVDVHVNFAKLASVYLEREDVQHEMEEWRVKVSKKFPVYGTYEENQKEFTIVSHSVMCTYATLVMLFNALDIKTCLEN